jgi:hypothetical protein
MHRVGVSEFYFQINVRFHLDISIQEYIAKDMYEIV